MNRVWIKKTNQLREHKTYIFMSINFLKWQLYSPVPFIMLAHFVVQKFRYLTKKRVYNKVAETDSVNADYTVCIIVHKYQYRTDWNKAMEHKPISFHFSTYLDPLYWSMCPSFVMSVSPVKIVYTPSLVAFFWKNTKIWESSICT